VTGWKACPTYRKCWAFTSHGFFYHEAVWQLAVACNEIAVDIRYPLADELRARRIKNPDATSFNSPDLVRR